ncbi:hypothetical protein LXL04_003290 [Taraxacum kok-saghyz]
MEKSSSVSNTYNFEDHNNGGRTAKNDIMNKSKGTTYNYSWGNGTEQDGIGDGGDLLGGFSWPPRSYTCTFCKREFRSAQALGGHMNVHRRDRARLRQMPSSRDLPLHPHTCSSNYSFFNPNSKPNPNPNFSPYCFSNLPSPSTMLPPLISSSPQPNFPCAPHPTTHPSYRLRPRGYQNLTTMMSQIPSYGVCKYDSFANENVGKIVKKTEFVRLNLEIGLLGEPKSDDLDLELRLGSS